VYSLGNVLYSILMQEQVFDDLSKSTVRKIVQNGTTPGIRSEVQTSFGDMEMAILSAMEMCHVFDEKERSSAAAIEDFLRRKLEEYGVEKF